MLFSQDKRDYHNPQSSPRAGFTIVETLVALVIATATILPIIYLSNSVARVSLNIRDDLIAAGLSQEGIEVTRAIRDANWLNGRAFDTGLAAGDYRLQWNSTSLLPANSTAPLLLSNGQYIYDGGTPTPFHRAVTITKVNAAELKIVSTITWTTATKVGKTISSEEHLFNWK